LALFPFSAGHRSAAYDGEVDFSTHLESPTKIPNAHKILAKNIRLGDVSRPPEKGTFLGEIEAKQSLNC
jgi:hypothetical protein